MNMLHVTFVIIQGWGRGLALAQQQVWIVSSVVVRGESGLVFHLHLPAMDHNWATKKVAESIHSAA